MESMVANWFYGGMGGGEIMKGDALVNGQSM